MTTTKATRKQVRENVLAKIEAALKDVAITAHQKKLARKLKKASHLIADFIWEVNEKNAPKKPAKKAAKKSVKKVAKPVIKAKKPVKKAAK